MIEIIFFSVCSLGWILMLKFYKDSKSLRKVLIKISISQGYHLDESCCSEKEYKEAEEEFIGEIRKLSVK